MGSSNGYNGNVPERFLLWICVTVDHGTVLPAFQVVRLSRKPGGEVQGFQGVGPVPGALPGEGNLGSSVNMRHEKWDITKIYFPTHLNILVLVFIIKNSAPP